MKFWQLERRGNCDVREWVYGARLWCWFYRLSTGQAGQWEMVWTGQWRKDATSMHWRSVVEFCYSLICLTPSFYPVLAHSLPSIPPSLPFSLPPSHPLPSLQMEQLEQKKLKKASSIDCEVKYSYSGSFCPLSYGLMTSLCAPKCSEGKIRVSKGDTVTVTRWQTWAQCSTAHWVWRPCDSLLPTFCCQVLGIWR